MLVWTVLEGGFKQVQVGLDVAMRRVHACSDEPVRNFVCEA